MKLRLIWDWKQAWRWLSIHFLALITAISGTWAALPADLKAGVSTELLMILMAILGIGGILGRLIDQPDAPKAPELDEHDPARGVND